MKAVDLFNKAIITYNGVNYIFKNIQEPIGDDSHIMLCFEKEG